MKLVLIIAGFLLRLNHSAAFLTGQSVRLKYVNPTKLSAFHHNGEEERSRRAATALHEPDEIIRSSEGIPIVLDVNGEESKWFVEQTRREILYVI